MALAGKGVLLTGGGSGIGRAIALRFASEGAKVVICGRRSQALEETKSQLNPDASGKIITKTGDISVSNSAKGLVEFATEALGVIDILVNNAGTNIPKRKFSELSISDWEKVVQINLNGTFYMTHYALPQMRARKEGLVINIGSIAGRHVSSLAGSAYCSSKFGVSALCTGLGVEEHVNGIRVTNICPGEVATEILDQRDIPPPPEVRAKMLQPEDLAAAALMVASLPPRAHVPEIVLNGQTTMERGGVPMW